MASHKSNSSPRSAGASTARPAELARHHVITFAVVGLSSLALAYFVLECLTLLGVPRALAELLTIANGLGTIVFPFSTVLFGHVVAAAIVVASFALILRWRVADEIPSPARAAALGLLWSAAIVVEYPVGQIVVLLGLYVLLCHRRAGRRELARITAFIAAGAAPLLLLHSAFLYVAFGSPFSLPYSHVIEPLFREHTKHGLFGVRFPTPIATYGSLVSRYRGLFFLSPFLALSFAGLALWWRSGERPRERLLTMAVLLVYTSFCCSYFAWDGGGSTGPRQIIPAVPFFVIAVAYFAKARRSFLWVTVALLVPSVVLMYAATATLVQLPMGDWYTSNPIYRIVLPSIARGEIGLNAQDLFTSRFRTDVAYNLGEIAGLSARASLLVLPALWAIAYLGPLAVRRLGHVAPDATERGRMRPVG